MSTPEAQEPETHEPGASAWCFLHRGRRAFAVGLGVVAEVVEVERLDRLPFAPPGVIGLCTLRRELLPVIALVAGDAAPPAGEAEIGRRRLVVLRTRRGAWALPADDGTTSVGQAVLEADAPAPDPAVPWLASRGTVRRGDTLYREIDAETTWQRVREGVETHYAGRWVDPARATEPAAGARP